MESRKGNTGQAIGNDRVNVAIKSRVNIENLNYRTVNEQ